MSTTLSEAQSTIQHLSFSDFLTGKWQALSAACAIDTIEPGVMNALESVLRPWGHKSIGSAPCYPSYVSADGFPAELSVSWRGGTPEIRVLFEPLGERLTPFGVQESGRAMVRSLAGLPGVRIDRYLALEDLFTVARPVPGRPGIWLSLAWRPGSAPAYKVYLNPQASGKEQAWETVAEAMGRAGMGQAWRPVAAARSELTGAGHELEFFALDLTAAAATRVKVYFRHHDCSVAELNRVASFATWHDPERIAWASAQLYGPATTLVPNEPMTCLAFRGTSGPEEANVYLRLSGTGHGTRHIRHAVARIMRAERAPADQYLRAIGGVASGALSPDMRGAQELLTFRTVRDGTADIGIYFRFPVYSARPGILAMPPVLAADGRANGEAS
jgi:tryptophan dimethylallyltransferase